MENKLDQISILKNEYEKLKNKTFNVYFFTVDTKGVPSGYISYIYNTAKYLLDLGYNVHMLHQEEDFIGVSSWMGEEYSQIPHHNIEKEKIALSVSDILFIPELFSNVMNTTQKVPCKRVALLQNFDYLTQIIPAGITWANYGIKDCITTTPQLEEKIKNVFPFVKSRVVSPMVDENIFNAPSTPKKLIINIVAKNQTDVNSIVKPFFWKYPMYRWVAFRELRGLSRNDFAEALKESAFTVWIDTDTEFGYSAIEAMKCRSIVIGKVPENEVAWMHDEKNEFINNGVWYFDKNDVHMLIAGAIESFIKDGINEEVYDEMKKIDSYYTTQTFKNEIEEVYIRDIFENHTNSIKLLIDSLENNKVE